MADVKPPTGPAVSLDQIGHKHGGALNPLPSEILDAINVAAAKNAPQDTPATPEPKEAPEPAPTPTKAPEPVPAPTAAKPDAPKEPPKEAPKGEKGIKEVREALERAQAKADELQNSLTATAKEKADAFTKVATLESQQAALTKDIQEKYEPSMKELEATRKRLQEKEEKLRIRDYMATEEWHEKYVKPIAETQAEVDELLTELRVAGPDGSEIQATKDHFNYVLTAPSANEAARRAKEMFGSDLIASQVVNYRARLVSLGRKQAEAAKNAQLESAEWEKNTRANMLRNQEETRNTLLAAIREKLDADSDFKPAEDDNEAIAALAQGQKEAELLLNGSETLTQKEILGKIADAQTKIRKAPLQDVKIKRLTAKVAELEGLLKQYQTSEPEVRTRSEPTPFNAGANPERDALTKAALEMAAKRG